MKNRKKAAYLCSIIVGSILLLVGLMLRIPGGALTTYESLDGDKTESYVYDDRYSSIDEYVGGDAYNYIIGASLVAGKTAGVMATKAVFIVGGLMCICFGVAIMQMQTYDGDSLGELDTGTSIMPNNESSIENSSQKCEGEQRYSAIVCPECGTAISELAVSCPQCGYPLKEDA